MGEFETELSQHEGRNADKCLSHVPGTPEQNRTIKEARLAHYAAEELFLF